MHDWSSDSLWNKAKLYTERSLEQDRRSDLFPFFASLGLEFLARAVLASVHPALLADPQEGNNILYAFGFPATSRPITIPAKTVYSRLKFVVDDFSDEDLTLCMMLSELRNQELHTGRLAFAPVPTGRWVASYYRVVQKIIRRLGYQLEDIFGRSEAAHVASVISQASQDVTKSVRERVGQLKGKISILSAEELHKRRQAAQPGFLHVRYVSGQALFTKTCPCCSSIGLLSATPIGATPPRLKDGEIVSQDIFWPTRFECKVCDLKLNGHEELQVVDLADQIVHEDSHDPVEFFEIDVSEYITDDMIRESIRDEYMNE